MRDGAVEVTDDAVAGPHGPVPVRRYAPGAPAPGAPVLIWLHGGAFLRGGLDQPESHDVALALAGAGSPVVAVAYRLATIPLVHRLRRPRTPAVHHPVPVDDVLAVLRAVRRDHGGGVLLGGASAGACLAAGTAVRALREGDPPLQGAVLAYGTFHAALPARPRELRRRLRGRRRFMHTGSAVSLMNAVYAGSRAALADPTALPGGHRHPGFPPALLLDAEHDAFRASGARFAEELVAAGVRVERCVVDGTDHGFLDRPRTPGAVTALAIISAWAARAPSRPDAG